MRHSLLRALLALPLMLAACAPAAPSSPSKPPGSAPAASAPVASAPSASGQGAASGPGVARELKIGIGSIPAVMDPAFDTNSLSMFVYNQVFDSLAVADERGNLQPALAESWSVSPDGTTWTFKLRQGVRFQNGEEFNAEAVKFTLQRIGDPEVKSNWAARVAEVASIDVVDPYTVAVTTKRPWAILLKDLLIAYVIPPAYYAQVGKDEFAARPIGTGPFQVREFDKLSHVRLAAWDGSWRGKPAVTGALIRRLPEAATRVAALEAGEVDLVFDVPAEDADRLKAKSLQLQAVNIAQPQLLILRATGDTPLKDRRVRQAMNYAVDKEAIVQHILSGYGRVLDGQLVGPDGFGYSPELKPYPYDPARAKQLLTEAGYPNGFTMKFDGTIGRYPKDKEIQEAIVAQMGQVGIKLDLNIVDGGVYIGEYLNGRLGPVFIIGQQYLPSMDVNQGLPNFRTAATHKQLASPEFDELYTAQASEMDEGRRLRKLQELSAWFRENAPVLFLHQFQSIFGLQPQVRGFTPRADYSADLTRVTLER